MSSIRRPRARWKPPAEPLLHGRIEPCAVKPEQALQTICDLTGEIERSIEGDAGKPDILLRILELSRSVLAEAESRRTLVISVEGYKSLLQIILTHLVQEGRLMNPADEKWLNDQLDTYSKVFGEQGFSMARSTGNSVHPAGNGASLFQNAHHFIINGGSFINHASETNLQGLREEILQSLSDGNSALLRNDIVKLQETSEMTLRAVRFAIIVLFY